MRRGSLLLALGIQFACSGTSGGPLFTDGGSSDDAGGQQSPALDAGFIDGSPENPLATGTCVFKLDGVDYSIPGLASMNGSGNLVISCADATRSLRIDVGNATYNGPGTYIFSSQLSKGHLKFDTPTARYEVRTGSGSPATTCTIVISDAPKSDFAQPGSTIQGTFSCTAVERYPIDEKGKIAANKDGNFDLTDGSFALKVR